MSTGREAVDRVIEQVAKDFDTYVADLQELCRIRSRRNEPDGMVAAARFIADKIKEVGGSAEVVPWKHSYPYVIGEIAGGSKRLLHFAHYDVEVEPAGDDDAWTSPPYAAEIRDGRLYARGVADDKGALMSRIHAVRAWLDAGLQPPVTTRYLIEGKQEVYSPGLESFVDAHREQLAADGSLWENSWLDQDGRPWLKLGEKGILYLGVEIRTLNRMVTSQNAALLPNAAHRLIAALATMWDAEGQVRVPGWDAGVEQANSAEREHLSKLRFDGEFVKRRAGVDAFTGGMSDDEAKLAIRLKPTLTVGGLQAGNTEMEVTLGVIDRAWAKLEIRLVAGQDPQDVLARFQEHFAAERFDDLQISVMGATRPNRTSCDAAFVQLVADAAARAYGTDVVIEPFTTWIGNQGVLSELPIVGVGVSRDDAGIDGPDEHIRLEDYRTGIIHVIEVMAAMAETF